MSITLVVITDGRDHIAKTIEAAQSHLIGPVTRGVIYDDSDTLEYAHYLRDNFADDFRIIRAGQRQGFGGAIRFTWRWLEQYDTNPFIFWLEDDFVVQRRVDLDAMLGVIDDRPEVKQLVLKRQAWNNEEKAVGGIIEQNPDAYTEVVNEHGQAWVEHRRFWSTNPHLTRRSIVKLGWPDDPHSEGQFTHRLLVNPSVRFAFWGRKTDPPLVEHIGHERYGHSY